MSSAPRDALAPFTVLVVCTGNICRSPLAEQLLRTRLAQMGVPAVVHSAGSRAMVGDGMTPEASLVSHRHGGADNGHIARQLTEALVAEADLVLTATRQHRSAVAALYPRAARYSYTLNQFARLLAPTVVSEFLVGRPVAEGDVFGDDAERVALTLRALVAEVAMTRGFSPPPPQPDDDDIEDPYRRSLDVYDSVGVLVDDAVTTISGAFAAVLRPA